MIVNLFSVDMAPLAHAADTTSAENQDLTFAEDRVLVILSNEASLQFNEYSVEDFQEIDCQFVSNLTETSTEKAKLEYEKFSTMNTNGEKTVNPVTLQDFYQIICLNLTEPGQDNVFNAIKFLQEREDVIYAGTDYLLHICATTPNDE